MTSKHERGDRFGAVLEEFEATLPEEVLSDMKPVVERYFHDVLIWIIHHLALQKT